MKLISSDEITIKSVLSNHEKTYHEIRDHILPTIRRMSRKMQSIIIKTTEQHKKMLVCLYLTNMLSSHSVYKFYF
jgi:hypothetical protein